MSNTKEKYRRKVPAGMLSLDEPAFKTQQATDIELINAYHWYGSNYDTAEGKKWLRTYLKNINTSTQLIDIIDKDNTPMIICSISRILSRGIQVPQRTVNYLQKYINNVQPVQEKQQKRTVTYIKPPTNEDKTDFVIQKIELEIDQLIRGNDSKYSFYTEAKAENLSKNVAKNVLEWTMARYLQIKAPELREYYASYSKKELERLVTFYNNIIMDCERIVGSARVVSKSRKTKEKSADKVLKNFKYKKQDDSYKITSIDPTKILKASSLVVFNTKYRHIMVYIAEENKTLFVKGTTIINFDQAKSQRKTLRKPQDVLTKLLSGTTASIRKTFEAIKTAPVSITSGRINEETILLRVT